MVVEQTVYLDMAVLADFTSSTLAKTLLLFPFPSAKALWRDVMKRQPVKPLAAGADSGAWSFRLYLRGGNFNRRKDEIALGHGSKAIKVLPASADFATAVVFCAYVGAVLPPNDVDFLDGLPFVKVPVAGEKESEDSDHGAFLRFAADFAAMARYCAAGRRFDFPRPALPPLAPAFLRCSMWSIGL